MTGRKTKRISKSASVFIPAAAFLILILCTLGISVFINVVRIEVTGNKIYCKEEVVKASEISVGDRMLFSDKKGVLEKISSSLPYVSEVNIEYKLPDLVIINVIETSAIAVINRSDDILVLDSSGRVLEQTKVVTEKYIEVRGFSPAEAIPGSLMKAGPGDETRLNQITDALKIIEGADVAKTVRFIDVSNLAHFIIGYGPRFTADFGNTDFRFKLSRMPDIIAECERKIKEHETGIINMSEKDQWRWVPDK